MSEICETKDGQLVFPVSWGNGEMYFGAGDFVTTSGYSLGREEKLSTYTPVKM